MKLSIRSITQTDLPILAEMNKRLIEMVAGYAVYQFRRDDYFPETQIVYLRQLYIERAVRSQGIGQQALQQLIEQECSTAHRVVIDVLATNPRGYAFWKRMGFEPYYTNMRLEIPPQS